MNFKNIADLNKDISNWIPQLPSDVECIVGIPRSGMLVGTMLALKLNLPLADIDGFIEGRVMAQGHRVSKWKKGAADFSFNKVRKVLIVDDSVSTGKALMEVKERIRKANLGHNVIYGAVYVTSSNAKLVDYSHSMIGIPRRFEWNILQTKEIGHYCFDLDGVICEDPQKTENDDGPKYKAFIANARQIYFPRYKLGWIVTSRLEKYRKETENWLRDHNIEYGELLMLDGITAEERRRSDAGAVFKSNVYKKTGADLFIESDPDQAEKIRDLSKRFTYCVSTMEMFDLGYVRSKIFQKEYRIKRVMRGGRNRMKKLINRFCR